MNNVLRSISSLLLFFFSISTVLGQEDDSRNVKHVTRFTSPDYSKVKNPKELSTQIFNYEQNTGKTFFTGVPNFQKEFEINFGTPINGDFYPKMLDTRDGSVFEMSIVITKCDTAIKNVAEYRIEINKYSVKSCIENQDSPFWNTYTWNEDGKKFEFESSVKYTPIKKNGSSKSENYYSQKKDSLENYQILNHWLSQISTFENNPFNNSNLNNLEFKIANYKNSPPQKMVNSLIKVNGLLKIKPEITFRKNFIKLSYFPEEENVAINFYLLEDMFVVSVYGGGSSVKSSKYDFRKKLFLSLPYEFSNINEMGQGEIIYSFFDSKDINDPYYNGHIFLNGIYDIKNDSIIIDRRELENNYEGQKKDIINDYNSKKNILLRTQQKEITKSPQNKGKININFQSKLKSLNEIFKKHLYIEDLFQNKIEEDVFKLNDLYSDFYKSGEDYDETGKRFSDDVENQWINFLNDFKDAYEMKDLNILSKYTIPIKNFEGGGDHFTTVNEIFENELLFKNIFQGKAMNYRFKDSNYPKKIITKTKEPIYGDLIFDYSIGHWVFCGFVGD